MSVEFVRLKNRAHVLPYAGHPGRVLNPDGEPVDLAIPFWATALADGSIEIVAPESPQNPAAAEAAPANPSQE